MKILREYTLDFIRRNRRSSLAVMVAILLTTAMLSMLCGFFWNMWSDLLRTDREYRGDWHGELFDSTPGGMLPAIYEFPSVDAVMIKGAWQAAKIDDPRREYLIYRDATAEYWTSMPERFEVMEGRVPAKSGELALSKQYFENHPELKIGDTLTLPVGERALNGVPLPDPRELWKEGETFLPQGEKTYTIVAKLDVTTSSTLPGYYAMGFLNEAEIKPDDGLTVYLRFKDIRQTYTELPKLAEAVGYQTDEYGRYLIRYNGGLLARLFIFPPGSLRINDMSIIFFPLTFLICGLLVVALFVMVIHNAFALSANSRLSQLGILASIGATPRQIKRSVILEGLLLSVIPLPLGIALGGGLVYKLIDVLNGFNRNRDIDSRMMIVFEFGLPAILPAVLLALLTVWFSASIPAKKVAKLSPIEAIRRGEGIRLKKAPKPLFGRLFGLEGELAAVSLSARKKAFRTATISLTLSVMLLTCILNITATKSGANAVYGGDPQAQVRDITLYISDGQQYDDEFMAEVAALDGVTNLMTYSRTSASMWVEPSKQSDEFVAVGGLAEAVAEKKYYPIEREGKYRVGTTLLGLDDNSFANYCAELGIDPAPYYNTASPQSIVYNLEEDKDTTTRRNPVFTEYLDLTVGESLNLDERRYDDSPAGLLFSVKVGHIADRLPPTDGGYGRYTLMQVVPMPVLYSITEGFSEINRVKANTTTSFIKCADRSQVADVRARLDKLVDRYYGSGDYDIYDVNDMVKNDKQTENLGNVTVGSIVLLLAIIGLSNVWATVSATLRSRRRELAMLRSMGLSPKGMSHMLALEAVLFSVTPLLLAIPVQAAVLCTFLWINEITFMEYLPFAPTLPTLALVGAIFVVVAVAYAIGLRQLQSENIVDAIKDETV